MKCIEDTQCPQLYQCISNNCQSTTFLSTDALTIFCLLFLPLLTALNNKFGQSSTWVLYLIFLNILSYSLDTSIKLIAPAVVGASMSSLLMIIPKANNQSQQPLFNYFIINILLPEMVIGLFLGAYMFIILPKLSIFVSAILIMLLIIGLLVQYWKEMRAQEKIVSGRLKDFLPKRNPSRYKRISTHIKMPLIQQQDGQNDDKQQAWSPSRKKQLRQAILEQHSNKKVNNIKYIALSIIVYVFYESAVVLVPNLYKYSQLQCSYISIISTTSLILLLIIGSYYLYKFLIQPKEKQQQYIKRSLGLYLDYGKTIQLFVISLIAAIIQGYILIGFTQIIVIYLLYRKISPQTAYAISAYLSLFLGISLSVYTLTHPYPIKYTDYLIILSIVFLGSTLYAVILQYVLFGRIDRGEYNGWLLVVLMVMQLLCVLSVMVGMGLLIGRQGWQWMTTFMQNRQQLCYR